MTTIDEKNIYAMRLHETLSLTQKYNGSKYHVYITRVAGGWIYELTDGINTHPVYIPYSDEFNPAMPIINRNSIRNKLNTWIDALESLDLEELNRETLLDDLQIIRRMLLVSFQSSTNPGGQE